MKSKALSITGSVLVAVWMTSNTVHAQSKETKSETIHPPLSGPGASVGGSRSERTGPGVPLPEGSRESGTVEKGPSGNSNRATNDSSENLKAVQQALKDKGYDPGPINGVMTSQTTAAIRSFQSASKISRPALSPRKLQQSSEHNLIAQGVGPVARVIRSQVIRR